MDQILDVLLDNAMAYAPGPIELAHGSTDARAWVSVRDHGPGIPPEERDRVTERFYRGTGAPSGGSGLGLAIARELAEKWAGTLTIAAAEGGGTADHRLVPPVGLLTAPLPSATYGWRMRPGTRTLLWAIGGLALALVLSLTAFAVAGGPISEPAGSVHVIPTSDPEPSHTPSPTRSDHPDEVPDAEQDHDATSIDLERPALAQRR